MYMLLAFLLAGTAIHKEIQIPMKQNGQLSTGSAEYSYFSLQAEAAVDILIKYLTDLDTAVDGYVSNLKTNNNATVALNTYNKLKESVKGTACESRITFETAQGDIEKTIKNCAAYVPQDDREALKDKIAEAVTKVQNADNNLELISLICIVPRHPNPNCRQKIQKALDEIYNTVSVSEKQKYSSLSNQAYVNAVKYLDSCVTVGTKQLTDKLNILIQRIIKCKSRLH